MHEETGISNIQYYGNNMDKKFMQLKNGF